MGFADALDGIIEDECIIYACAFMFSIFQKSMRLSSVCPMMLKGIVKKPTQECKLVDGFESGYTVCQHRRFTVIRVIPPKLVK